MLRITVENMTNKAKKTSEEQYRNRNKMWPRWIEHQHSVEKQGTTGSNLATGVLIDVVMAQKLCTATTTVVTLSLSMYLQCTHHSL